ncbi:pseudaminic acid synthase [Viridibacterium curvum]|uniref:Pseudaminic acid synthase n=2 Tax=Viridibacterium curvum TaxID=1101404 RepID=A0ABP9QCJ6_9RHOO
MIEIGGRPVGTNAAPFFIAEMSGNHNASLDRALEIVDAIADTGAHALKLQTYTADTMTLDIRDGDFLIDDPKSLWHGRTLYDLYEEAHTPWAWHEPIFERARKRGMLAFSTPFDPTAVDFLASLDVPCYKIASFENADLPLIHKAASQGKPLIISTGMASLSEIGETVATARAAGCEQIVLLKCTSAYPASPSEINLMSIPHLREAFGTEVGLSDHTMGIGVAVAAVALGASVIEKHVTLRRADGGVDSAFSMEPDEVRMLIKETAVAQQAIGSVRYGRGLQEEGSVRFRRSLYVVTDIKAGEAFSAQNVRAIRPGMGLLPKHTEHVMGRKAARDIKRGTPMSWDLLS